SREIGRCGAGRKRLGITPFGKVNPCNSYGEGMVLGDLHTQTITEIWRQSPALRAYRTRSLEFYPKCKACHSGAFCEWCPGLHSWAGHDHSEPYEQKCRDTEIKKALWEERTGRTWISLPIVEPTPGCGTRVVAGGEP